MIRTSSLRVLDASVGLMGAAMAFVFGLATAILLASGLGLRGVVIATGLMLGMALLLLRDEWLVLGFYFAVMVVEEFLPELIVDQRWDRSLTILYGRSIGLPAIYVVDAALGLLLGWLALRLVVQRRSIPLLHDSLTWPIAASGITLGLSCLISLTIFPDTATPEGFQYDEVKVGLDASIAPWIPYLQVKTWLLMYATYALTRIFLSEPARMRRFLQLVLWANFAIVAIGAYRFLVYRFLEGRSGSLFYDDATLFVLILSSCFLLLSWGRHIFSGRTVAWQAVLVAGMLGMVLLSFRRGSWLGAAVCLGLTLFLMPPAMRRRAVAVGAAVAIFGGLYVAVAGADWVRLPSTYTSLDQRVSNVYRTALLYNLFTGQEFSLFGYGLRPLWDVELRMGSFTLNFENVHNLYYWFILRTGLVGFVAILALFWVGFRESWRLRRTASAPWIKVTAETMALALILFLLLGWFHPLYGMTRFVVLLGTVFGVISAVRQINGAQTARQRAGATRRVRPRTESPTALPQPVTPSSTPVSALTPLSR